MIPETIEQRYKTSSRSLEIIEKHVSETILNFCNRHTYAYVGRIKTVSSVAEKLESGRYRRWSDLDDLFGCAIVVPTLEHEAMVLRYLAEAFEQQLVRSRFGSSKAPDVFRFDATRFYGRMRFPPDDVIEFENLMFEVQVRTAFEHAWSAATHALTYRNDVVDWRRLRLSAQIKAAVEQLDLLIAGFDDAANRLVSQQWTDVDAKTQVVALFEGLFSNGNFPSDARPKDLGRFAANLVSAMQPGHGKDAKTRWDKLFRGLEAHVKSIPSNMMPRSISLFQFVVAEASKAGIVKPTQGMHLPITREVVELYPEMKSWAPVCDITG